MAEKLRLALVGCGGISGAHVTGYKDLYARGCRDFEVSACCDTAVFQSSCAMNRTQLSPRADTTSAFFVISGLLMGAAAKADRDKATTRQKDATIVFMSPPRLRKHRVAIIYKNIEILLKMQVKTVWICTHRITSSMRYALRM